MEVTQKTWKTSADWQKNGNNTAPAQKNGADEVSVFGAGVQDIEQTSIEDIFIQQSGVKTADTLNIEAPADDEALIENFKEAMTSKKGPAAKKLIGQKDIPLMSSINEKVLSADDLKKLAGIGNLKDAEVIENLTKMKDSLSEDAINTILKKSGVKNLPNPKQVKVTASCSDCGRGWGKCNYSNGASKNEDTGTWDEGANTKANEKTPSEHRNHKIYLLRMPGKYSYENERYTKNGQSVLPRGKQIIENCNTTEQQINLGTIYNLQQALESMGVKIK